MEFKIQKPENPNLGNYPKDELDIVRNFAKLLYKELGDFLKTVVLFGSSSKGTRSKEGDIDVLVIVDDLSIIMTQEIVEAYRIITEKVITQTSTKLHVISLKLTNFWEYIRSGDPVGINMLRDGIAVLDTGLFDPLQMLLRQGRIRPTEEAVNNYFGRAPRTLTNAKWHLLQATVDLYWAVIDAAHAALMRLGEVPTEPELVADMLEKKMVKKHLLEKRYVATMRHFYKLSKMITHRQIREVKGQEFENYYREASAFVSRMREFLIGKKK